MNLSDVKAQLENNPSRELVIEILNQGDNFSPLIRATAYMWVQSLSEEQFMGLSKLAVKAIEYLENRDFLGLEKFLESAGVPAPFLTVIKSYAGHFDPIQ